MAIQLLTFGGLRAIGDDGELDWLLGQHTRAALLVYLAVERRVSRESLTALFWPESDAENARHALRQSLYQLRKAVGAEWVESHAHELAVADTLRTDAYDFEQAVARGDVTAAVHLYGGAFLDGVHLVDLKPWESWVDARRAQFARAFRKSSRELLEARRLAGDHAGAVAVAERWAARDAEDGEAQHRLIEALAAAGERAEAIRQYEAYARRLEPDGLRPLDETVAMAERLRIDAAPLPSLRVPTRATLEAAGGADAHRGEPERAAPTYQKASSARAGRWLLIGGVFTVAAIGTIWALRSRPTRAEGAGPVTTSTVAVLPFSVRGSESVAYLREGSVNLLSVALDGGGLLRPVDTRAIFAAAGRADSGWSPVHARTVASRLGATMYVLGDVVESGGQVQIEAAIYPVVGNCGAEPRPAGASDCTAPPRTKGVVTGSADSVFALVDKLAAQLLGGLGDPAADRLVRTASLTTTSLPAFKAYLQGEGLMRAGQFERAADAYLTAIAHDSTFAVAHYRLALAREWAPLPGEEAAARAAARHGARLSPRDRGLLDAFRAWRSGDATEAERAYRGILARYPDDVDAWFQLGEVLFHHGPLWGRPLEDSEDAWRKVLAYEPRSLFALTHIARIALVGNRIATVDSLLATFPQEELHTDRRLAELVLLRAVAQGDTATAFALAEAVRRWEPFAIWRVAVFLTAFTRDHRLMRSVIDRLMVGFPSPAQRADLYWFTSLLDLAGGRVEAAQRALTAAAESESAVPPERRRPGFRDVTEWFAVTLPLPYAESTLVRVRRDAVERSPVSRGHGGGFETEMGIGAPIQTEPVRQYTLGVLSLRLRDLTAAEAAAAKLQRLAAEPTATALVRDLERSLRARLEWQRGRADVALRLLESLESRDSQGDMAAIPFVSRASERYLRGEILASMRRDADALEWFKSLGTGSVTEVPLSAPSHLRQAELHERLGRRSEAAMHYRRFLELWHDADPELRATREAARQRLARLTRQP